METLTVATCTCMGLTKISLRMPAKSYINLLWFFLSEENSYMYK